MGHDPQQTVSHAEPSQIEVRLRELAQLFNSMDPSPFSDRDLDAGAEQFIVGWARELPHPGELELIVHLAVRPDPAKAEGAEEAVRHYFADRAAAKHRELRALLRRGRASLFIGVVFLAGCFAAGEMVEQAATHAWREFLQIGLQIVGWVAMWRPIEIFLYDWWPIRNDRLLLERLARMRVRLELPAN